MATRASGGFCSGFFRVGSLDGEVVDEYGVATDGALAGSEEGVAGGVARQAEARLAAHNQALDRSLREIVCRSFCFGAIRGTMEFRSKMKMASNSSQVPRLLLWNWNVRRVGGC